MSRTKVIRGEGGRFQSVPDNETSVADIEPTMPLKSGQQTSSISLIGTLYNNQRELRNESLKLMRILNDTALVVDNTLYRELTAEDDSEGASEAGEHTQSHFVDLFKEAERYQQVEERSQTAGNILSFHVVPTVALALFVLNTASGHDRSLAIDNLRNCRDTSDNCVSYENIVNMHNVIQDNIIEIEQVLFGIEIEGSESDRIEIEERPALLRALRAVDNIVTHVRQYINDLTTNIENNLL